MLGIVGLPVPDETVQTFVGYLSAKGTLRLDRYGLCRPRLRDLPELCRGALSRDPGPRRVCAPAAYQPGPDRAHLAVDEPLGKYTLLIAYFIAGVRHVAAMVLGASLVPPGTFRRYAYTGAVVWSGTFIGAGYAAGEQWQQLTSNARKGGLKSLSGGESKRDPDQV